MITTDETNNGFVARSDGWTGRQLYEHAACTGALVTGRRARPWEEHPDEVHAAFDCAVLLVEDIARKLTKRFDIACERARRAVEREHERALQTERDACAERLRAAQAAQAARIDVLERENRDLRAAKKRLREALDRTKEVR